MRLLLRLALVGAVCFLAVPPAGAQGPGSFLELTKSLEGGITDIDSGEFFTYVLQYRCVNITQACENVIVTDILPPELSTLASDVILIGSVHTTGQTYNPATRTVTWTFINPLPAGSTGELKLTVRFPEGVTPDLTTATNQAEIDASNSPNPVVSNQTTITAHATNQLFPQKLVFGGVPDEDTSYIVQICRPPDTTGQLNMTNVEMVDTLPAGVTFVSASDGGVYDPGPPQSVRWIIPEFDVTDPEPCISRTVTVRFESGAGWNIGDPVSNTVTTSGTPIGETTPVTSTTTVSHNIVGAQPDSNFRKTASTTEGTWGQAIRYGFVVQNTGNVPLDNYRVTDIIPDQLNVVQVHTGSRVSTTQPLTIRFQTNLNAVWTDVAGSPFTITQNVTLTLPPGEYVTALQWDFGRLPPGFSASGAVNTLPGFSAQILQVDRQGNTVGEGFLIRNSADAAYEYGGQPFSETGQHDVRVTLPTAQPLIRKNVVSGDPANPGDLITYRLRFSNLSTATFDLVNPVFADFLDTDVEFVGWTFDPNNTGIVPPPAPEPLFEQIDNYDGTGRTLLRWRWEGTAAYRFLAGEEARINYQVRVKPGTPAGSSRINNMSFLLDSDDSIPRVVCIASIADTNDLDGDGDRTELLCRSSQISATVNAQAVMESAKWVRGDLDTDWQRYPAVGNLTPGGTFDYRLMLTNVGNVSTTNITIIDVLPHIGDTGVIDLTPRDTEWEPTLEAVISAPPGVTVSYSAVINPCRPELVPSGPPGCNPPNWSTAPPADLTFVQAMRFDLGGIVIDPLETFEIVWTMRAPQNVIAGQMSWNSFGYVATRLDNGDRLLPSEPLKVGVTARPAPLSGGKAFVEFDGTWYKWKLVFVNNRNAFAVNAEVIDPLTPGIVFDTNSLRCEVRGSSVTIVCEWDPLGNRVVWRGRLGADLGNNSETTADNELVITFSMAVPPGFPPQYLNQASVTVDSDNDNDFADEPTTSTSQTNVAVGSPTTSGTSGPLSVPCACNVGISKTSSAPFVLPGTPVTWTIIVTNDDLFPADNVTVTDNVPNVLEVISATATAGTVTTSGQTVTLTIATLAPGQQVIITVNTRVRPNAPLPFVAENRAVLSVGGSVVTASGQRILSLTRLPTTGESPAWRLPAIVVIGAATFIMLTVIRRAALKQRPLQ